MRQAAVLAHRWVGLTLALFLVMTGLTGSLLAWRDELDALLAPELHLAASGTAAALDPFVLRAAVERQLAPRARVDQVKLHVEPGHTVPFGVDALTDPSTGRAHDLGFDEVFADPATGRIQGTRQSDRFGGRAADAMPFVFRLHDSFALPSPWGTLLMGVVALLWTVDCFVGAWLTFPRGRPWWRKWGPAWRIKWGAASQRVVLDMHRAGGLWPWALLFVMAWSSVMFTLRDPVYRPVMGAFLRFDDSYRSQPARPEPLLRPALDWPAALAMGRRQMALFGERHGFTTDFEEQLSLDRRRGLYAYWVHSRRDLRADAGNTAILFDADTGELRGHWLPTGGEAGDTVSNWLGALHMAHVFGRPYKVAVSGLGIVVAALAGTGVWLWWRKRRARRLGRARRPAESAAPQVSR